MSDIKHMYQKGEFHPAGRIDREPVRPFRTVLGIAAAACFMWVLAGLWHNLIVPSLYEERHASHDGIGFLAVAYLCLASLMAALAPRPSPDRRAWRGLVFGALIGVLWVFPHGLAMVGAHGGSLTYLFQNSLWHVVEQACGGFVLFLVYREHAY